MRYTFTNRYVLFGRGSKPRAIAQAQREVRDTYLLLCDSEAPQVVLYAKAHLIEMLGKSYDLLAKKSPTFELSVESALRAYRHHGKKLRFKKMFSMDLYVPTSELGQVPGCPPEIIERAQAEALPDVCFLAREEMYHFIPKTKGEQNGSN